MTVKRFIFVTADGRWAGSVFAERVSTEPSAADPQKIATFYTGSEPVAQVDCNLFTVHDSGGRTQSPELLSRQIVVGPGDAYTLTANQSGDYSAPIRKLLAPYLMD